MKEHNKKWLISMMKSSGSRRRYMVNGRFSDERNTKKYRDIENLPTHESIGSTWKLFNGKLNYGLLIRFLYGQIGNDWDKVYSEIKSRIPKRLLEHENIVFWFVADKIEIIDGKPFNKKANKFIWTPEQGEYNFTFDNSEFYVDPTTNKLLRIADTPSRRATKNLTKNDLREYREKLKREILNEKQQLKEKKFFQENSAKQMLVEHNKLKKSS